MSKAPKKAPAPAAKEVAKGKGAATEKSGNNFTRMFGKKNILKDEKANQSIIETIVSKKDKETDKAKAKLKKEKDLIGLGLLKFSKALLQFSVAFILISAGFFYAQNIDEKNRLFNVVGLGENYAIRLHDAAETLEDKKELEAEINEQIELYRQGYSNRYESIVSDIVSKRMNWPDILNKINEISDSIYERNILSQYIQYNSFSFNAQKGTVSVSGTLSDPLGKNLTKLAELEEAFRTFPKDANDPNDTTEPYFYNVKEFNSLRKTLDKKTGKYRSTFQISFSLREKTKK